MEAELAGGAIITWLLVEAVKFFSNRKKLGLSDVERDQLHDIYKMNLQGQESCKAIYAEIQKLAKDAMDMRNTSVQVTLALKEIMLTNERILKVIERLEDKLN